MFILATKSETFGIKSITNHCIYSWNTLTENLDKPSTHSITTVKKIMCNKFIANYWFGIRTMLLNRYIYNRSSNKIHWSLLPLPSPTFSFFFRIIDFHNTWTFTAQVEMLLNMIHNILNFRVIRSFQFSAIAALLGTLPLWSMLATL